jgi:hypothetical protein
VALDVVAIKCLTIFLAPLFVENISINKVFKISIKTS